MPLAANEPTSGLADQGGGKVARVRDLELTFERDGERVEALRGVDLEIGPGEIVGIVGESGSGKTVLGLSMLGLLPRQHLIDQKGHIEVAGIDMVESDADGQRLLRKRHLGAVFQDPMTSLSNYAGGPANSRNRRSDEDVFELMAAAGIPDPERRAVLILTSCQAAFVSV